jgi:hypothetical protein
MFGYIGQSDFTFLVGTTVWRIRHAERTGNATWTPVIANGHPIYDREAVEKARRYFATRPKWSRVH